MSTKRVLHISIYSVENMRSLHFCCWYATKFVSFPILKTSLKTQISIYKKSIIKIKHYVRNFLAVRHHHIAIGHSSGALRQYRHASNLWFVSMSSCSHTNNILAHIVVEYSVHKNPPCGHHRYQHHHHQHHRPSENRPTNMSQFDLLPSFAVVSIIQHRT